MNPLAWLAIGFIAGVPVGAFAVLYFLSSIPGNLAHMFQQSPKE